MKSKSKKYNPAVATFALASFLNDAGSDMIQSIWPLFLKNVLGVDMVILGLIDGIGEMVVSVSQSLSGYFSDKLRKRKVFIWGGYVMAGLSRVGYAIAFSWPVALVFKVMDRAGKIREAPRDAIVADLSTDQNRGSNFGWIRTMDNLGSVFAIILAIFLIRQVSIRTMFMIAAIPSLIGAAFVLWKIREPALLNHLHPVYDLRQFSRSFKWFLALSAIFATGTFSYSFLLVLANTQGFSEASVPILYLLFTGIASITSLPFGKLADRFGRKPVMQIGFLAWAAACLLFTIDGSKEMVLFAFTAYGLYKGAIETVQRALVAELVPAESRASGMGIFKMVVGLCALPSSLIAGLLWDGAGFHAPFFFSVALTAVASVMLVFLKRD